MLMILNRKWSTWNGLLGRDSGGISSLFSSSLLRLLRLGLRFLSIDRLSCSGFLDGLAFAALGLGSHFRASVSLLSVRSLLLLRCSGLLGLDFGLGSIDTVLGFLLGFLTTRLLGRIGFSSGNLFLGVLGLLRTRLLWRRGLLLLIGSLLLATLALCLGRAALVTILLVSVIKLYENGMFKISHQQHQPSFSAS